MPKQLTAEEILKLRKPDEYYLQIELGYDNKFYNFIKDESFFIDKPNTYSYVVYTNENDNLNDIISNKEAFEKSIIDANNILRMVCEDEGEEETYELIENMDYDKFFNNDFIIKIIGEPEQITSFLNKNKIENHKIILSKENNIPININEENLLNYFISNLDSLENIYISGEGNDEKVSIDDYKKTINYIDDIVNRINKLDLSPIEKLMYAYDIVRDRKYNKESKKENYTVSRDLTSVTQGDKIVCVGFAKIYDMVVKKLGFNSLVHSVRPTDPEKPGHARNMVYVKDEKYDIDGVYFFDPTFGSKRKNDDSHYNSYKYFAKAFMYFYRKDKMDDIIMRNLYGVNNKILKEKGEEITRSEINSINYLYKVLYNRELLSEIEILSEFTTKEEKDMDKLGIFNKKVDRTKLYKDILEFINKFHQKLTPEQFMNILTNVRIQEYSENSKKFPLSTEKIFEITRDYYGIPQKIKGVLETAIFGKLEIEVQEAAEKNKIDKTIKKIKVKK